MTQKIKTAAAVVVAMAAVAVTGAGPAEGALTFDGPFEAAVTTTQAGAHPDARTSFAFRERPDGTVDGEAKDILLDVPRGLVGDPRATPTCDIADLVSSSTTGCPRAAMVGVAKVHLSNTFGTEQVVPVFNVDPPVGVPASFAFNVLNAATTRLDAVVRTDGDYGLTVTVRNVSQAIGVKYSDVTLWGVPADHNGPGSESFGTTWYLPDRSNSYGGRGEGVRKPFLTNASECGVPSRTTLRVNSWADPTRWLRAESEPTTIDGCDGLVFAPGARVDPSSTAPDSPTGLSVELDLPQDQSPDGLGTPPLRKAVVSLPEGMSVNPAAADGLAACSDAQLGLGSNRPIACPDGSRIGSASAITPVLEGPVSGGFYLRSQNSSDPDSGEMFRVALVLEHKERGILAKLPGSVRADARTGRLTATFDEQPQLPVSKVVVRLNGGSRAALATSPRCGVQASGVQLSSWGGQSTTQTGSYTITQDANGRACAGLGFNPSFNAGMLRAEAGKSSTFSPFNLVVAREDGMKELKAIKSVRLPEGLLGRVASVPLCGEAQAAAGTCSEASRVGHVQAALGSGSSPLWVPQAGKTPTAVYLSGPYRGAPYSLAIVVPAQAGPFDLGRVVVRSALHVDERTTAITTGIDETRLIDTDGTVTDVLPEALPTILKGIVLRQREIRVIMDREDFMVNPTDCSQKQITAEVYSVDDDRVDVGNPFRAVDCAVLGFTPKFRAKILNKGRRSTLRSFHPRTRFAVVPRKGDANIGGARVVLPSSTLLDQANIGTTCTRAQMAERNCPEKSIVGYAKAWSPLLRDVVEGPVYLAANGGARPLPDLAAVLDGEIRVVLQGEISTQRTGGKARLQNTFRVVPDAPVSRFVLTMRGGKKRGLLVNSTDLCRSKERGVAAFIGQNNRRSRAALRLTPSFKGCKTVRRQAARKVAVRKAAARKAARNRARRAARS